MITGINPKASFGNIPQQAAGYYTLRFAGLFNLPIPLRFAFGIGVSTIKMCPYPPLTEDMGLAQFFPC